MPWCCYGLYCGGHAVLHLQYYVIQDIVFKPIARASSGVKIDDLSAFPLLCSNQSKHSLRIPRRQTELTLSAARSVALHSVFYNPNINNRYRSATFFSTKLCLVKSHIHCPFDAYPTCLRPIPMPKPPRRDLPQHPHPQQHNPKQKKQHPKMQQLQDHHTRKWRRTPQVELPVPLRMRRPV